MARPMFTAEQVHQTADALAAEGKEVTALTLLSRLGGGSLTTIYKHMFAWREARQQHTAPANAQDIPDAVQSSFANALTAAWRVAATEAAKEVTAAKEKAAEEVQAALKQFQEALQAIERLEDQADADAAKIETLTARVADTEGQLRQAESDRSAAKATAEQLHHQLKSQALEREREREEARTQITKSEENLQTARAQTETALREAAQLRGQSDSLKAQNSELLAKLSDRGKSSGKQ